MVNFWVVMIHFMCVYAFRMAFLRRSVVQIYPCQHVNGEPGDFTKCVICTSATYDVRASWPPNYELCWYTRIHLYYFIIILSFITLYFGRDQSF